MKNKKIMIVGIVGIAAIVVLLVLGFAFMDQFQAQRILDEYFQDQQVAEEQLTIDDYKGMGVVKDESGLQDFNVKLSEDVKLNKLYAFVPTSGENTKPEYVVDVQNKQVYEKEIRKELPNSVIAFYKSLVPGRKTVLVTLETETPTDYKVSYADVELTYNDTLNAFVGDVDINAAEDLKPR